MNDPDNDGRIVLCKNTLKSLRRKIGSSQEKMAFLCAERGLCVSVASIKRAETSKNVIYRTARDIALFFDVDITDLVVTDKEDHQENALIATHSNQDVGQALPRIHSKSNVTINRNYILLIIEFNSDPLSKTQQDTITDSLDRYRHQYDAINCSSKNAAPALDLNQPKSTKNKLYFTFGSGETRGNETQRSLQFSFSTIELIQSLDAQVKIALTWCNSDTCILDDNAQSTQIKLSLQHQQKIKHILESAPENSICIDDKFKNNIREKLHYQPVLKNSDGQNIWQVSNKAEKNIPNTTKIFVGRKIEIIQFQAVLESAKEYKSAQLVYLVGPAGIGKSHLVEEYTRTIAEEGFETHTINIFDYNVGQKQQPIPQLMRSLLNLTDDLSPLSAEDIIKKTGINWLSQSRYLPILYSLLNWQIPKPWLALLETMTNERLFLAQCELITAIIKEKLNNKPLMLTVEDYHWVDKKLRVYLNQLINKLKDFPIVFLFTSRPSDSLTSFTTENGTAGHANTVIHLSPLSQKDALILANSFTDINNEYRGKCIEKAQGNPLFLEQLLKDKNATYNTSLPFSLQSLISARIESMNQSDQLAVRAASVIGPRFSLGLLRKLTQDPLYNIEPLIHANIIHHTDNDYAFNHALILEGIYLSLSEEDRNKFHYTCSEWFHQDLALQCHHLLKADHADAINKIVPAIQHLIQTFKFEQAKNLINIGLKKFPNTLITSALYGLDAEVNNRQGETQLALDSYHHQLHHSTSNLEKVNTLIGIANCFNTLDQEENALTALNKAHTISIDQQYLSQLSRIYYLNGNFLFPKGKVEECFEYQEKALNYAREANNKEMEARALGGLGDAAYAKGKMFSAHTYFSRCLELSEKYDLKQVSAANLFMLGTVNIYHNKTQEALAVTEQSIQTAELVGHKRAEIVSRLTASWILLDWLRLDEALEHINIGLEIANEIGAKRFIPFLLESKARYYFLYSEKEKAIGCIDKAIEDVEKLNAHAFIGPWLLGTRATLTSNWTDAEQYLKAGLKTLEQGSIGHNHYRFYIAAIETCLQHKQFKNTSKYLKRLKTFTHDEETPWSNFYIHRAEYIINQTSKSVNSDTNNLTSLIEIANNAKLLTALPALEELISDIPAL